MGLPRNSSGSEEENLENGDPVALLTRENRRLARQLEAASAELAQHRLAGAKDERAIIAGRDKAENRVREQLAGQIAGIEAENGRLQRRLAGLERQMAEQGKTASLPAEQVAALVNGLVNELVDQLDSGLPNMNQRAHLISITLCNII